jgi:hypothetical protein
MLIALVAMVPIGSAAAASAWPPPKGAVPDERTAIEIAVAVHNGWARPGAQLKVDAIYPGGIVAKLVDDPKLGKIWSVQDGPDLCSGGAKDNRPCSGGFFGMLIRQRDGAVLDFMPLY